MFNEFKPTSKSEWLEKVVKDTKGRKQLEDFNWAINDLRVSPFYHREDRPNPLPNLGGRTDNNWEIGTTILVKTAEAAKQQALAALEAGAQSLCFIFEEVPNKKQLETALQGIQHEWISTHFRAPDAAFPSLIDFFLRLLQDKGQDATKISCSFSTLEPTGPLPINWLAYQHDLPRACFQTIKVAKGDVVKDLAQTLVAINQCLSALADTKVDFQAKMPLIQCIVPLEDAYFPFLAKVRALKMMAQQVLKAWNIQQPAFSIVAELDATTLTEDENYNRIKMTSQAMSAVTAGVDGLFLNAPSLEESDFGRRIALNIQHLLQQESFMNRVADPAAGSYFIDHLTQKIGEEAWSLFQQINAQS